MLSNQLSPISTRVLLKPSSFVGMLGAKNEKIMKYLPALFFLFVFCTSCQNQDKSESSKNGVKPEIKKEVITSQGPQGITRTIIQDSKGAIWIAAFDGIFRYDGKSFTNITSKVSSARFFSVLEDSKGNMCFGTIGSGVYYYDGKTFKNFTTKEGLVNNEIGTIYEDSKGDIWFGANGGASRFDGESFKNYMMKGEYMSEVGAGEIYPNLKRNSNEVTSIIEDQSGKFWFGTRGNAFVYDGETFTVLRDKGKPFINVRSIIEDNKGTIWLGSQFGLWRYDDSTFTKITQNGVSYVYKGKDGDIWTSSSTDRGWVLSKYDEKFLLNKKPIAREINPNKGKMLFGILEANDGSIWFGADGAYRYDGNTVIDSDGKVVGNNWTGQ
ncbi:Two-component system sensor histidine kinase/response [Cyclobacterium amurskyense]|uniref:Two-component system sensor histidine kinase/response n=2 Tax=Cyclobacterium amurskyense TaxID=320787 RepID=A0A0H4PAQ0_9BACT|nr:Two-component system sensor histidine kinase/response [Cyclobacterium amurskyense]